MLPINIVKHNTLINLTTKHFSYQSHYQSHFQRLQNLEEDSFSGFQTQKRQRARFYCIRIKNPVKHLRWNFLQK